MLNFALAGVNTGGAVERLREEALAFAPKIVVYGATINDIEGPHYRATWADLGHAQRGHSTLWRMLAPRIMGVAEKLYQRLDDYTNQSDGLITEEVIRLTSQNEDYVEEIETIEARLLIFQNKLIEKYAAMERAVAAAEAAASQLEAFLKGGDD